MYIYEKVFKFLFFFGCRFDGKDFLRRMKGKKIMFVGDSVSENHFQSLVCLLSQAEPSFEVVPASNNLTTTVKFEVMHRVSSKYLYDVYYSFNSCL